MKGDILYLHVTKADKRWLKALCNKQKDHVSLSEMAARIFKAAKSRKFKLAA
jgi:hypothetical protein